MTFATERDRAYFARIGRANLLLEESQPPTSLRESLARTEQLRTLSVRMGHAPNISAAADEGDLDSHLAYLARLHARRAPLTSAQFDVDDCA